MNLSRLVFSPQKFHFKIALGTRQQRKFLPLRFNKMKNNHNSVSVQGGGALKPPASWPRCRYNCSIIHLLLGRNTYFSYTKSWLFVIESYIMSNLKLREMMGSESRFRVSSVRNLSNGSSYTVVKKKFRSHSLRVPIRNLSQCDCKKSSPSIKIQLLWNFTVNDIIDTSRCEVQV